METVVNSPGFSPCTIVDQGQLKFAKSPFYNYMYHKDTGFFMRWGEHKDDKPDWSPYGPEILDIEITTVCKGPGGQPCAFCYKGNGPQGENMTFATFKEIIDKAPLTLTQVALGADAQCESNPQVWEMMAYCNNKGIRPNITVADISDEVADKLVENCGAVAVSRYENKDLCYNTVQKLVSRGMKQVNIHCLVSQETLDNCLQIIEDYHNDSRLVGMNYIVFLSLKKVGRGTYFNSLDQEGFNEIVRKAFEFQVQMGFDSCSAGKARKAMEHHGYFDHLVEMTLEPCESTCFSGYFNVRGEFFPCSFTEGTQGFVKGLQISECQDFIQDIWMHPRTKQFRMMLLKDRERSCPIFEV